MEAAWAGCSEPTAGWLRHAWIQNLTCLLCGESRIMAPSYFSLGCRDFSISFAVTCRFSWPLFVGNPSPRPPVPSSSDSTCFSLRGRHQPLNFCYSNQHGRSSPQILKKFLPEHTPVTSPPQKLIVPMPTDLFFSLTIPPLLGMAL